MSNQTIIVRLNPAQNTQRRRVKRSASKDGGGKQMKRRTRFSTVACRIHGKLPDGAGYTLPELRCAIPRTKAQKYGGCPKCNEEKRAAKK